MQMRFEIEIHSGSLFINGHPERQIGMPTTPESVIYSLSEAAIADVRALNGVYNKAVYWPQELELSILSAFSTHYLVETTRHARERIASLRLPAGCYRAMLYGDVVEATVVQGAVQKVVTRLPDRLYPDRTLCAAICFTTRGGLSVARVVTMWVNRTNDMHKTIHVERYVQERVRSHVD